jgi:protein-tyrosine phosphatase
LLVACRYGVSRSSTFVLAYLVQEKGYDLPEAWHLLRSNHPLAYPARELWQSLLAHYRQPYTMADVEQWLIRG